MSKKVSNNAKTPTARGPTAERVKTAKSWEDAIKGALKKKRPTDGWPEPEMKKGSK